MIFIGSGGICFKRSEIKMCQCYQHFKSKTILSYWYFDSLKAKSYVTVYKQAKRLRSCKRRSDSSYALWLISIMINRHNLERQQAF